MGKGKQKEIPPLYISILLFVTSIVTLSLTTLLFFYCVVRCLLSKKHNLSLYLSDSSKSIDQTDNVLGQHAFNDFLIKRTSNPELLFGNMDETISSNIGENQKAVNLSWLGRIINTFLSWLDPGHSINAIEEDEV